MTTSSSDDSDFSRSMHSTSELELAQQRMQDHDLRHHTKETVSSSTSSSSSSSSSRFKAHLKAKKVLSTTGRHFHSYSTRGFKELSRFLSQSAAMDLALAVIISDQVLGIVKSCINDVIMPPIGLLVGSTVRNWFYVIRAPANGTAAFFTPEDAAAAGAVTINPGRLVQTCLDFMFLVLALFGLFKLFVRLKHFVVERKGEDIECPACFQENDCRAIRCRHCTSFIRSRQGDDRVNDESFESVPSEDDRVDDSTPPARSLIRRRRKSRKLAHHTLN
jgi:large conductance mechanosensitive channel